MTLDFSPITELLSCFLWFPVEQVIVLTPHFHPFSQECRLVRSGQQTKLWLENSYNSARGLDVLVEWNKLEGNGKCVGGKLTRMLRGVLCVCVYFVLSWNQLKGECHQEIDRLVLGEKVIEYLV